jgi:hypothetical protein
MIRILEWIGAKIQLKRTDIVRSADFTLFIFIFLLSFNLLKRALFVEAPPSNRIEKIHNIVKASQEFSALSAS